MENFIFCAGEIPQIAWIITLNIHGKGVTASIAVISLPVNASIG